jgi:hypothetical protein
LIDPQQRRALASSAALLTVVGRRQFAGTIASERQMTGIINLNDGFKAASSLDRLSSLDPLRLYTLNDWSP